MAQRIVGVDISAKAARIVVLETTLRKTTVMQVATVALAEGQERKDVLAAVHAAVPGAIDSVLIAADPRLVSTRVLHFPFADLRKVESALAFELENQVPYEMQNTALTWHVAGHAGGTTDVLAALMPKKPLEGLIAEAEGAGLEPRAIVLGEVGLAELAPHHSHEALAIAALGDSVTHVAVVRDGLRYARTLRSGGLDIDRALARAFAVEPAVARAAKQGELELLGPGAHDQSKVQEVVAQGLAALVTGLSTTFKSLAVADAPTRLLLTGGLSRLPGLCDFLRQKLGIPVELVDLQAVIDAAGPHLHAKSGKGESVGTLLAKAHLARFATLGRGAEVQVAADEEGPAPIVVGPEYAIALGLALAILRHGRSLALNFRRGELAYQGDMQLYRGHVTRIATGVGIVFALAIVGSIVRYSMLSAEETRLNAAFCVATKKIVGREICDPTAALATLRQAPGSSDGVIIPTYSAATLFEMLSKSIGTEIDASFDDLELKVDGRAGDADRINGKGEAASFESTEQIAAALKRDPCVQEVEVSKQRKVRDGGRVEFNLAVKVTCPSGVTPGQPRDQVAAGAPPTGDAPAGGAE